MGVVKHKTISSSAIGHRGAHWRKLCMTFGYGAYFLIAIRSIDVIPDMPKSRAQFTPMHTTAADSRTKIFITLDT